MLYWAAPNVKQPGFRWISPGGVLAVLGWVIASAAFAFYVANFGSYNKTYGALAGPIVFLVWLWISNIMILLGAEFNAELERGRAIEAGHAPGGQGAVRGAARHAQDGEEQLLTVDTETEQADGAFAGYAGPGKRPPLGSYAALTGLFNAAMAAGLVAARRSGHELPERVDGRDLALAGVATHKLSRLIAKDKIIAFARAPFTEYQRPGGPAEVEERARGEGLRRTVGELLVCPYCLGMWISGGFHLGLVVAPRATRFAASVLTGLTISDFLQIAYKAAEERASCSS